MYMPSQVYPDEAIATMSLLSVQDQQPNRKYANWTDTEEGSLIAGVQLLGIGSWEAIRMEDSLGLR